MVVNSSSSTESISGTVEPKIQTIDLFFKILTRSLLRGTEILETDLAIWEKYFAYGWSCLNKSKLSEINHSLVQY